MRGIALISKPNTTPYQPAYEVTAVKIAELIEEKALKSGDRLPTEQQLSVLLGVSRTVIREAIKVLVTKGQVLTRKGSGMYVSHPSPSIATASIHISMLADPEHVSKLFDFRVILETNSARMAARLITHREVRALEEFVQRHTLAAEQVNVSDFHDSDVAFHTGVARATQNPFLVSSIYEIMQLQDRTLNIVLAGITPGSLREASLQHKDILEAIKEGNEDDAAAAMLLHLRTLIESYELEVRRRLQDTDMIL
jgi:GntR family transcriptional regulator, transcriptional repressor for pyruvate dehydrogenase complex